MATINHHLLVILNDFYVATVATKKTETKNTWTQKICWRKICKHRNYEVDGKSQICNSLKKHNLQFFLTANAFWACLKGKRFLRFLHPETTSPANADFSHPAGEPGFCSTRLLRWSLKISRCSVVSFSWRRPWQMKIQNPPNPISFHQWRNAQIFIPHHLKCWVGFMSFLQDSKS